MKNFDKTLWFTVGLSLITIITATAVQLRASSNINVICSYLDPAIIDVLAFVAASFLIVEGAYRIYEHKGASLRKQITRSIRIAFGFAILTLHIIQIIYK